MCEDSLEFLTLRLFHTEPPAIWHSSGFATLALVPTEVSAYGFSALFSYDCLYLSVSPIWGQFAL